jgi:hypothetical protein
MVMSLLVYGVLPRILTLALARARLRAACRLTLIALPGLSPVLHRLHQAHVRTTSDEPETGKSGIEGEPPPRPAAPHPEELGVLINWSAVPVAPAAVAQAFGPIPVHPAGGSVATADDRTLGTRLAGELADGAGIGILVKAWEPPLMEWVDFVKDLRSALPARTPILVLPVGVDSETRLMDGEPAHTAIWVRKIRSLGDPWLNPARLPEVAGQ